MRVRLNKDINESYHIILATHKRECTWWWMDFPFRNINQCKFSFHFKCFLENVSCQVLKSTCWITLECLKILIKCGQLGRCGLAVDRPRFREYIFHPHITSWRTCSHCGLNTGPRDLSSSVGLYDSSLGHGLCYRLNLPLWEDTTCIWSFILRM